MKLIDTTVLLEFFSGSEEEIDRIDAMFKDLERRKEKILITEEVILELVYYLEHVQGWEREVVSEVVTTVINDSLFKVESSHIIREATRIYGSSKIPFLDCLKAVKAKKAGVKEVIAYSRRFERAGLKVFRP
jgi:predicted nucleic-acid-binding protein